MTREETIDHAMQKYFLDPELAGREIWDAAYAAALEDARQKIEALRPKGEIQHMENEEVAKDIFADDLIEALRALGKGKDAV